ncbi:hypothetical protein AAMO2058_000779800 [Amorphochlora amoebiformis]
MPARRLRVMAGLLLALELAFLYTRPTGINSLTFSRGLHARKGASTVLGRAQMGAKTRLEGVRAGRRKDWGPDTWKRFPVEQQPQYPDERELGEALETISRLPPLVQPYEVEQLKNRLKQVFNNERFIIQAGDCAERFSDCSPASLDARIRVLEQMRLILTHLPSLLSPNSPPPIPVSVIRRAAGQYGKPRSSNFESVNGDVMMAFKGDNVNDLRAVQEARVPDPKRLVEGVLRGHATMNYLRSRLSEGLDTYIDPRAFPNNSLESGAMAAARVVGSIPDGGEREVYTSHEGLLLGLEQAMTRKIDMEDMEDVYYNSGAHFVWIGTRTKHLNGAHVEYFRGIANPIGIKVGSDISPESAVSLIKKVDPDNEPGKIVLICRFGAQNVTDELPALVDAVGREGLNVVWFVDPMHGNTRRTQGGLKTRDFDNILREIAETHRVLKKHGEHLGGIHLELTGEDVTECVGGRCGISDDILPCRWASACDPRLNYDQSLELACEVAKLLSRKSAGDSIAARAQSGSLNLVNSFDVGRDVDVGAVGDHRVER